MGGLDRIGGAGTPDSSQVIGKKAAPQAQPPATQDVSGNQPTVDTTRVVAPKAADLAPVIAKFAQPVPVASNGSVAAKAVSMVDPIKETARKVLDDIKKLAGGLWHTNPDRYQDGLGNTR